MEKNQTPRPFKVRNQHILDKKSIILMPMNAVIVFAFMFFIWAFWIKVFVL